MATLEELKEYLRSKAILKALYPKQALSDSQYSTGFNILVQGSTIYQDFIIPQLSQVLSHLLNSRQQISVLEIGPGPESVLGSLPNHQKRKIRRYTAFEPNGLFATRLEASFCPDPETEISLPCLESLPNIHRIPFTLQDSTRDGNIAHVIDADDEYDIILFCHSMYGMQPKREFVEQALGMLGKLKGGMVVIFHRDGVLHLDGLVCNRTASFPAGVVRVADDDEVLDGFAPFIAGFTIQDEAVQKSVRVDWREVCRNSSRHKEAHANQLLFSSPNMMVAFTQHATMLPELTAQVPSLEGDRMIKNREARVHRPASIVRPTEIQHIQLCVRWALRHSVSLTVIAGSHSGHCVWNNVVSIDMSAFNQVHILTKEDERRAFGFDCKAIVVAEAGCLTGDIIRKAMMAGVTVPLGSRPSVGAGLWLQGGIGHLARMHGLACDAIVGAVVVSVDSSQVLCIGYVPSQHRPAGSIRPKNEADILWAIKGAGTRCGIVVSVVFKAYAAPTYLIRNWIVPLSDRREAQLKLMDFDKLVARNLDRKHSADAYLYWDAGQLHLGVTMVECSTTAPAFTEHSSVAATSILGVEDDVKIVDGVGLFETEMYVSKMHGGHAGSKTSSFKRCLFFKNIGDGGVAERLVAAVEKRPSPLCYLHLLQGGGAVGDVGAAASAFGCRDWDFACVITGVWPRVRDGTKTARAAVEWVYSVVGELLSLSSGAYGADLGPDPKDALLATRAFGPSRSRLAYLINGLDPHNVLAYACPLPNASLGPKLILLVTGESCAGKDYCADVWASMFKGCNLTSHVVSISEAIKREYAAVAGVDPSRLLRDRAYKEQHRPALTTYFQEQVQHRPQLPKEQFLNAVCSGADADVLLITGMRDKAPVAAFSHLVPSSRLLEVYVQASEQTLRYRKTCHLEGNDDEDHKNSNQNESKLNDLNYRPNLIFDNETTGNEAVKGFFRYHLLSFVHEDLQRLADMVHPTPDFPHPNIVFRHVLGISQQPGGLALCTSLLQDHFAGDWAKIAAVVCCEVGGIVFASPLALQVNIPLVIIREAGKLPPPTVSVIKSQSYISSLDSGNTNERRIAMERDAIPRGSAVVVVDDVLSTGETLCAVLQMLARAGVAAENVSVMVVAEFPVHRGRELLCQRGFGKVSIQSLLVFGGT